MVLPSQNGTFNNEIFTRDYTVLCKTFHHLFIMALFWAAFMMPQNEVAHLKFCVEHKAILYWPATEPQNMLYLHAS